MEQSSSSDFSLSYSLDRPLFESSIRLKASYLSIVEQDEEVVNFDDDESPLARQSMSQQEIA